MNQVVVGEGVAASQIHGEPVGLTFLAAQRKPRQLLGAFVDHGVKGLCQPRKVVGDLCPETPRAAVRQHRQIIARFQPRAAVGAERLNVPNSTKWLPLPLVPICVMALSCR